MRKTEFAIRFLITSTLISLILIPLRAQDSKPDPRIKTQDESINNLRHPSWYIPKRLGELGGVLKIGNGRKVLVLLPGMGFNHSIFTRFMMRNHDKYTMYAFTPAGYGMSVAPPIPKIRDYGKRKWSKAFERSVVEYLKKRNVKKIHLLGFFSQGVQHAIHIADSNSGFVEKLILVGGELKRELRSPVTPEVRVKVVNEQISTSWFKTVTPKTWYEGMFKPGLYSADSIRSQRVWEVANQPSIPTLVQYLCEFLADDPSEKLKNLGVPVLVVIPKFDEAYLNDKSPTNYTSANYTRFNGSWKRFSKGLKDISLKEVRNSRVLIFEDQPAEFDRILAEFMQIRSATTIHGEILSGCYTTRNCL
ncbi:MAG: alpha/beta hydrolase [Pyrinomonadaceae bacterium]|nr:alpha/beta hydrolase [Pyrinomonadaceae bacterium]